MRPFPLEKVLDYRRHLRLERRNVLAAALSDERALLDQKSRVTEQKQRQIVELGEVTRAETVRVEAAARRRYFASRLEIDLLILNQHIEQARERVEICRQALIQADQEVKALEKLREKFVIEQKDEENKKLELALAEQWQAAHWG